MIDLSSIGLWVGGLLLGVVLGGYMERRRRPSVTERRPEALLVETDDGYLWVGPRDRLEALNEVREAFGLDALPRTNTED